MTYSRTEIDLYRGQPARALARLEAEWGRARLVRQVQQVACEMLVARARLLLATAKHERRSNCLRQAAADSRKLIAVGRPYTIALGTLLAAGVASFERRADALRLFDRAEGLCRTADMQLHAAVCRFRRAELQGTRESFQHAHVALEQIRALGAKEPRNFAALLAPVRY